MLQFSFTLIWFLHVRICNYSIIGEAQLWIGNHDEFKTNTWTRTIYKYKCFRQYRLEHSTIALNEYNLVRRKFKRLCQTKQSKYKTCLKIRFENCKSPAEFWKMVKSCKTTKTCVNNISAYDWNVYFSTLLNTITDELISMTILHAHKKWKCWVRSCWIFGRKTVVCAFKVSSRLNSTFFLTILHP